MSDGKLLVTLNPADVAHAFVRRSPVDKLRFGLNGLGQPELIRAGGWDRMTIPATRHPGYRLIEQLAEHDFDPALCFDALYEYFRDKGRRRGHAAQKARNELSSYVREYEALYKSMKAKGYVEGRARDEIGLAINRAGAWVKVPNGNHRFHVALVLGLHSVTAEVRFVHRQWFLATAGRPLQDVGAKVCRTLQEQGVTAHWAQ